MPQAPTANLATLPGSGHSARLVANHGGDLGILRPFCNENGAGTYVSLYSGKKDAKGRKIYKAYKINNTPAPLDRDAWLQADRRVAWQAKLRLQFANAIRSRNSINLDNGFGTAAYQYWFASGQADAKLSMDPIEPTERSAANMDAKLIPTPIAHSKGSFTARQIAIAENSRLPLNTTGIALSGRAVAEIIENLFLGTVSYGFAEGTIYGALNFPQALSASFTAPPATAWNPKQTLDEMLAAFELLKNKFYRGPYVLFYSNGWAPYFDTDYGSATTTAYSGTTLRTRLQNLPSISAMQNVDMLPDYTMILVDMSDPEVFASINGVGPVTVQWQEEGGQLEKYMVMLQQIPLIKRDFNGFTGILNIAATIGTTTSTTTTTTTTT